MALYLSVATVFLLSLFSFYDRNCRVFANQLVFWMFLVFLLLLAGFRYGIETDYWSYKNLFLKDGAGVEVGFKTLITFCKNWISDDFNVFILFFAVLSVFSKGIFFSKLRNPFLALFLYYCLLYVMAEWNTIRQGFAISFLMYSLKYAKEKKIIHFGILVAMATSMHISSLLFIPMYFIYDKEISVRRVWTLVILLLIFKIFVFNFLVAKILEVLSLYIGNLFLQRLYVYMSLENTFLITVGLIRRLVFLSLFLILYDRKKITDVYFNAYIVGVVIYIVFMGNSVLSSRMSMSYDAMMIPMFANIKFNKNWKSIYCLIGVCLISVALFYVVISGGNAVPYRSYIFM